MNPAYLDYLYTLGEFNIKLGLNSITDMLERLNNPHHHPRIIHIAGTNGKGSTLVTLERFLIDKGYRTGSTISPHLISFNERFRINGESVADDILDAVFEQVCEALDIDFRNDQKQSRCGRFRPTFFEFAITLAFVLFKKEKVDYILLETGLGGRLDATNVIRSPLACIITRIAIDHQDYLGHSIESITDEKLGIVKPGTPLFVAEQEEAVKKRIKKRCLNHNSNVWFSGEDFGYESFGHTLEFYSNCHAPEDPSSSEEKFQVSMEKIRLPGNHQLENIATAVSVFHYIAADCHLLTGDFFSDSLSRVEWPGRLQFLDRSCTILIDGAHNVSGMESLMSFLKHRFPDRKIIFAICWKKGKNFIEVFKKYDTSNIRFIPVRIGSERSESVEIIYQVLRANGLFCSKPLTIAQLMEKTAALDTSDNEILVIAGSLYMLGEFLEIWNNREKTEDN